MRFLLAILFAGAACGADVYVARNGNDASDGTQARPLASLERARDEARKRGGGTVFVRAGVYELAATLKLEAADSGATWRAYPGEKVTLSGGVTISGFTPYKGAILEAKVPAGLLFRQLFFAGRRQPLARYPNFDAANPYGGGWAYADGKRVPMYQEVPGEDRRTLRYKPEDARAWARPEEAEVVIFPRYNWWNNIVRIRSLDRDTRTITLAADCSYAIRPGDRYYVQGLIEELDAPGEWYLDTRAGTLYFWPPEGARGPLAVTVPRLATIVEIGPGASDITLRGFTFEASSGTAIVLHGTRNCRVAGNTIRNVGDYRGSGVAVNGGTGNGVVGNDIYATGAHGIPVLYFTVLHDELAIADRLRRSGADVNEGDGTMTALHAAALFNKPDMATWLLKHKARRDVKDFNGKTPLEVAEEKGNEAVAVLLRRGAV